MAPQSAFREQGHTVPMALAAQLVDVTKRWDLKAHELLAPVGLTESALEDPSGRLPVPTMCTLLERARHMTGEPGLGYYLGLHTSATLYGYLGFAALSASCVGDALNLVVRFAPMFSTALAVDLRFEGPVASLLLEERADFGPVRDIVLISTVLGLREIGRALTGRPLNGSADFAIPEPSYRNRFAHLAGEARFGQRANRIMFDAALVDLPIVMANRTALRLAQRECERELDELGFDSKLSTRVRRLIGSAEDGLRTLEQVAPQVGLSPRTLRRRLAARGTPFSALVDDERRDRAVRVLRTTDLPIGDVARRLEYTSVSSFVRAFRRWTGKTPSTYRRDVLRSRSDANE